MRVLFALPGLHRYNRGAEVAFISVAKELARLGHSVALIGSGLDRKEAPYRFLHANSVPRDKFEKFPFFPVLRHEYAYEELTFVPHLARIFRPKDYDVTLTCNYPFTNWILRRPTLRGHRPPHVYVTENGDWPAYSNQSEFKWFGCEGLICTNPDFYERNRSRWNCALIPNGIDCDRFKPGTGEPKMFGLPNDRLIILMVSALIQSKRIEAGIEAVSRIPNSHLVVAGAGPLRQRIESIAVKLLPERFTILSVSSDRMPALYRSANVFLHMSKEEAFGNVFLEAIACGLPVVGQDSARVRWIVGDNQFLVDTGNLSATAAAIAAAADATELAVTERVARAATFSWTRVGTMYESFLQQITTQAGT